MSSDLLIKINADAKNAKKAFDDVRKQSEDLEDQLKTVAVVSGLAFAALVGTVYVAERAFADAEKQAVKLTTALQNQGIYTPELEASYVGMATELQKLTGQSDDAIKNAFATAQGYLHQTVITKDLAAAIVDLGAKNGDLNGAAEKIARTIGTNTNAFAREGLVISATATEAERYATVLAFVQAKAGGLGEALNKADGYANAFKETFGDFLEGVGSRFAPIFAAMRQAGIAFFNAMQNPIILDLTAALIAAGIAVTGLITALAVGIPAFAALSAAAATFGVTLNLAFAGIPVLIGAVVAGLTLIALNWDKTLGAMSAAWAFTSNYIAEKGKGLGKIIQGIFTLDPAKIKEGADQLTAAFDKAAEAAKQAYKKTTDAYNAEAIVQDAAKKAQADKEAAALKLHQSNLREIQKQETELLRLQNENASAELIALKVKEIETLKALDTETSGAKLALLRERRAAILELETAQQAEDIERAKIFEQTLQDAKNELKATGVATELQLSDERIAALQASALTEADIEKKLQEEILKKRLDSYNQRLIDAKKYGVAFAAINKVLQSDEVKGATTAAGELVKLQSSKSAELKAIGKGAALAQIAISTAESAMNIYRGFSTIPIIGPALGVAGAIAAVAFGAERTGDVLAAATGGLVEGGVAGRDSVPALLMPGELVVPKRNYNDVVGAVQNKNGGGDLDSEILSELKALNAKMNEPRVNNFYGDVSTDESFVDNFVKKISDSLEFRNGQIFGVNT